MSRPCHVVRVFTRDDEGGNHLGVVLESGGLRTVDMQRIATDLGFSETIFYEPGEPPSARIFTPGREMPFAGHPLVGLTWVLHETAGELVSRLACGIGRVRVGYESGAAWIEAPAERPVRPAPEASDVATALGIGPPIDAIWVDMPVPYLLLELESEAAVAAARFSEETMHVARVGELYLYARVLHNRFRARFFAPEAGVFEDPATGSAAVALATRLIDAGEVKGSAAIDQGEEIGHPSTIDLNWDLGGIRIGGTVRYDEQRMLDR